MLSGIGTIGSALAIIAAGLIGRQAAKNFRAQKRAERVIEHAEKALAAAYKVQEALSTIRSPLTTGPESAESRAELDETDWFNNLPDDEKSRTVQANVFYQRIRKLSEGFDEAIAVMPFVKAYFGEDCGEALKRLISCRHTVRVYADAYARDTGQDPQHSRRVESYVWEGATLDEVDPIASRVNASLQTLENALFPVIRSDRKSIVAAHG